MNRKKRVFFITISSIIAGIMVIYFIFWGCTNLWFRHMISVGRFPVYPDSEQGFEERTKVFTPELGTEEQEMVTNKIKEIKRDKIITDEELLQLLVTIGKVIIHNDDIESITDGNEEKISEKLRLILTLSSLDGKYDKEEIINIITGYKPLFQNMSRQEEKTLISFINSAISDGVLSPGEALGIKIYFDDAVVEKSAKEVKTKYPSLTKRDVAEMERRIKEASKDGKYTEEEILGIILVGSRLSIEDMPEFRKQK